MLLPGLLVTMALVETLSLVHLPPGLAVHIVLYQDVQNAAFLHQQLLKGNPDFEYAFIDASVVGAMLFKAFMIYNLTDLLQ